MQPTDTRTWTDDQLIQAVKESNTIASALRKLGLCPNGGAHGVFHRHANRLGLSTSHFDPNAVRRKTLKSFSRYTDVEVFSENSEFRGNLRRKVRLAGFLEYKCEACGNDGTHNGKSLVLQIDHKNGVHSDNRRENLRYLCPNCHSQTNTFAGKRSKKPKATGKGRVQPRPHKRKVDHDAVRSRFAEIGNYSKVAREFNISDPAVHRIVKKLK